VNYLKCQLISIIICSKRRLYTLFLFSSVLQSLCGKISKWVFSRRGRSYNTTLVVFVELPCLLETGSAVCQLKERKIMYDIGTGGAITIMGARGGGHERG